MQRIGKSIDLRRQIAEAIENGRFLTRDKKGYCWRIRIRNRDRENHRYGPGRRYQDRWRGGNNCGHYNYYRARGRSNLKPIAIDCKSLKIASGMN